MLLQIFIFSLGFKKGDKNNIDEVIKYIINRFYYDGIDPAELFFFGLKFDENNKVNVGNGTDESHFNICFSTLKLLKRLENIGMFHVDCTYKIIKYFYLLLVFVITDYARHFHSIVIIYKLVNKFAFQLLLLLHLVVQFHVTQIVLHIQSRVEIHVLV